MATHNWYKTKRQNETKRKTEKKDDERKTEKWQHTIGTERRGKTRQRERQRKRIHERDFLLLNEMRVVGSQQRKTFEKKQSQPQTQRKVGL